MDILVNAKNKSKDCELNPKDLKKEATKENNGPFSKAILKSKKNISNVGIKKNNLVYSSSFPFKPINKIKKRPIV